MDGSILLIFFCSSYHWLRMEYRTEIAANLISLIYTDKTKTYKGETKRHHYFSICGQFEKDWRCTQFNIQLVNCFFQCIIYCLQVSIYNTHHKLKLKSNQGCSNRRHDLVNSKTLK